MQKNNQNPDQLPSADFLHPHKIRTWSGRQLDIFNPDPEDIILKDIARGLGMHPKFNGQTPVFISLAEHSVSLTLAVEDKYKLPALFYIAPKAYLGDPPLPFIRRSESYKKAFNTLMQVIALKFDLPYPTPQPVRIAAAHLMAHEYKTKVLDVPALTLSHRAASSRFINTYYSLIKNG